MRLSSARAFAVSLALCAMVLRALLPDGWMPSAGAAPFTICSVDGIHHDGKTPGEPAQQRSHTPCAFAAAAPLAPPSFQSNAVAAPRQIARLAFAATRSHAARQSAHRPNAARAPPAFS
ncbi:MAG TPA: hypothetical protein VHZ78_08385 [Rhizomicrobium sp.]|jgi:hypothetical protein|nr:hypothetical protein [Rhizomicrobium sp.]